MPHVPIAHRVKVVGDRPKRGYAPKLHELRVGRQAVALVRVLSLTELKRLLGVTERKPARRGKR